MKFKLSFLIIFLFAQFAQLTIAKTYNLEVTRKKVQINDKTYDKIVINNSFPGPTLRFIDGEDVTINVINKLKEDTSMHWHGLLVPGYMDGVPDLNGYPSIQAGETFTYHFKIRQVGTYWYHSHTRGQEQEGEYGAIIISPKGEDPIKYDREYIVMLSDSTHEKPATIMNNLKASSDYYQYNRLTIGDFFKKSKEIGFSKALKQSKMWGRMRMMSTDLSDVTGYIFLVNGKSPKENWTAIFKPQEKIRLRFINASAMTFFDVRIPGLKMSIVASDGQNVEAVQVDEFRLGTAEIYDVIVSPQENKAYSIVAESIDRTGFAVGTIAPRENMHGSKPIKRKRSLLTMRDMRLMPSHKGHLGHNANSSMASHNMASHNMVKANAKQKHSEHSEHSEYGILKASKHSGHDMANHDMESGWKKTNAPKGTKTLDYSDLRYLGIQKDTRKPMREVKVRLGGNMERYLWTMDGKKYQDSTSLYIKYGDRVKITFVNQSMMAHPMHLHGMFFQLENGQPLEKLPNKNLIIIPPGDTYSIILTADEIGEWAFHCHLLYHMMAGMFKTIVITEDGKPNKTLAYNSKNTHEEHSHEH